MAWPSREALGGPSFQPSSGLLGFGFKGHQCRVKWILSPCMASLKHETAYGPGRDSGLVGVASKAASGTPLSKPVGVGCRNSGPSNAGSSQHHMEGRAAGSPLCGR